MLPNFRYRCKFFRFKKYFKLWNSASEYFEHGFNMLRNEFENHHNLELEQALIDAIGQTMIIYFFKFNKKNTIFPI